MKACLIVSILFVTACGDDLATEIYRCSVACEKGSTTAVPQRMLRYSRTEGCVCSGGEKPQ